MLIERADELWSFSHLTFQEHFTLRWLTQLSPEQLTEKITDQQWQERVKQLVKSQQSADRLIRLIKQAIDQSISREPTLQKVLVWVLKKSESIQANYKPDAIRAYYFTLTLDLDYALAHVRTLDRNLVRALAYALAHDFAHDFALARACALVRDLALDLARARDFDLAGDFAFALDLTLALDFALALDLACTLGHNSELINKLEQLRAVLPASADSWEFQQWWQDNETQWVEQLRQVMIQYRNIGHDWQLMDQQRHQLQRYYDANRFLVELINIEGAVTDSVRAEIEDSLLLPWEELQKRSRQGS